MKRESDLGRELLPGAADPRAGGEAASARPAGLGPPGLSPEPAARWPQRRCPAPSGTRLPDLVGQLLYARAGVPNGGRAPLPPLQRPDCSGSAFAVRWPRPHVTSGAPPTPFGPAQHSFPVWPGAPGRGRRDRGDARSCPVTTCGTARPLVNCGRETLEIKRISQN